MTDVGVLSVSLNAGAATIEYTAEGARGEVVRSLTVPLEHHRALADLFRRATLAARAVVAEEDAAPAADVAAEADAAPAGGAPDYRPPCAVFGLHREGGRERRFPLGRILALPSGDRTAFYLSRTLVARTVDTPLAFRVGLIDALDVAGVEAVIHFASEFAERGGEGRSGSIATIALADIRKYGDGAVRFIPPASAWSERVPGVEQRVGPGHTKLLAAREGTFALVVEAFAPAPDRALVLPAGEGAAA